MKTVKFEGGPPRNTEATRVTGTREWVYRTPAEEFELRRVELTPHTPYRSGPEHGAEILLVLELDASANVTVTSEGPPLALSRGGVCLIPRGVGYSLDATGPTMICKAVVPG